MGAFVPLIMALVQYFTKNGGLNTVSGGFLGAFGALFGVALAQTSEVDQIITWLQNQGEYGLIAGAVVAGLRVALVAYRSAKA
jgi:hypothetical protein